MTVYKAQATWMTNIARAGWQTKKIKIYVPLSLERKHHSNVLVWVVKSTIIRPAKTEFTNLLIKNDFMRNLNNLKGAPTKFKNVSIKHDMTPEERLKERQLHLKTKELNNEIQSDDPKNEFYVVRGCKWDRNIVKVIK